MVELKDFVRETLVQIIAAVAEAQQVTADSGAAINPSQKGLPNQHADHPIQTFDFDIAITAVESDSKEGGLGAILGVVSVGARAESEVQSSQTSRVRFSVGVRLPPHRTPKP